MREPGGDKTAHFCPAHDRIAHTIRELFHRLQDTEMVLRGGQSQEKGGLISGRLFNHSAAWAPAVPAGWWVYSSDRSDFPRLRRDWN